MSPRVAFFSILVVGVALDLWSKDWAFDRVPSPSHAIEVVDRIFYIDRAENSGGMFSLGTGVGRWLWVAIRVSVVTALFVIYRRTAPTCLLGNVSFGLVLSGALGNIYDNLFWVEGRVRDFLRVDFHRLGWDYTFPIFNVADSMITVGAPLLLWFFYRLEKPVSGAAS